MIAAKLVVRFRLYASQSLKEKRLVVKSVKTRLRQRFNVAVAETGALESWRDAELALVTISGSRAGVDRELEAITRFLDNDVRFEVYDRQVELC